MIKVNSLGSSSSGNCFVIRDGVTTIIIDAGLQTDDIRSGLFKLGIRLQDINGVLITHEHQDHIQGVHAVRSCIKYMTKGTYENMKNIRTVYKDDVHFIKNQETFKIGTFTVKAFKTKHDAKDPVGFILKNISGEKILYLTDTGIANVNFRNAELYIIEANHSETFLKRDYENGNLPKERYLRVTNNHLSSEKAVAYLKKNMGNKTEKVILMHLSPRNKNPVGTMAWVRNELDSNKVDFIHPVSHKITKTWEIGFQPKRKRGF